MFFNNVFDRIGKDVVVMFNWRFSAQVLQCPSSFDMKNSSTLVLVAFSLETIVKNNLWFPS